MKLKNNTVRIVTSEELKNKLKELKAKGLPIRGFDPSHSYPFDDYLFKILSPKKGFTEEIESLYSDDEIDLLIDKRNEKLVNDLKEKSKLEISEGYSFEDVKAEKAQVSILDRTRVDDDTDGFEELPVVIKIGDKTFGTLGNFSMIIGKPKSGKSFLNTLLAGAALSGRDESGFISVDLPQDKQKVVLLDTEQSAPHVKQMRSRINYLANDYAGGQFETYSLRGESVEDRLFALDELYNRYDDIGLVIIDGIKDLVYEINNEKQATEIANTLLELTQKSNSHIIIVLHQNKGDDNARGHLGTELLNKAETTASVSKRKGYSVVKVVSTRNEEFPPFAFSLATTSINNHETVTPYIDTTYKHNPKNKSGTKALTPSTEPIETHKAILTQLHTQCLNNSYNKGDAKTAIMDIAKSLNIEFGNSKAQKFFTYYEDKKWVEMVKKSGKGRAIVSVNIDAIN